VAIPQTFHGFVYRNGHAPSGAPATLSGRQGAAGFGAIGGTPGGAFVAMAMASCRRTLRGIERPEEVGELVTQALDTATVTDGSSAADKPG